MIIQCPHCQTQYSLEEKQLGDSPSVQIHCKKCQKTFSSQAGPGIGPMAPRHTLVQHQNEFNKRLQNVTPPCPVDVTTARGGDRPWLDRGKVVSLVVIDGPLKGKVFPVVKPGVLLGRRETDIVLEDSDVSRKHCYLEVHGATALLVDLGSTNGTFVDNQKIETRQLEHMSEFRVGSTTMIFSVREKE
jgi:predicted Zn finger-like uncharacterized protein